LKFKCQESCGGKCCKADWRKGYSTVFLTWKDQLRLVKFLKESVRSFADYCEFKSTRFTDKVSRQWVLRNIGDNCRFFKDGKCQVYDARPTQCRTFPFWPENMNQDKWAKLGEACPGIGKGESQPLTMLLQQVDADNELCNQSR